MNNKQDKLKELRLTKRQMEFCLFYLRDFDAKKAVIKSGLGDGADAKYKGMKLLTSKKIKNALLYLKNETGERSNIELSDIFDFYVRIAFADHGESVRVFTNEKGETQTEIDFDAIDGQLIDEITISKNSVKVKFLDKFKALEKLERFFVNENEKEKDTEKNKITVITAALRPRSEESEEN